MEAAISNKRLRRKANDEDKDDLFNRLPNELILSHIFSRFTFEEGAQLCILSKRWNKLWAQTIPPKLIFALEDLNPPNSRIIVKDDQQLNREKPCFRTTKKERRLHSLWGCSSRSCSRSIDSCCSGFSAPRDECECTYKKYEYRTIETPYDKVRNRSSSLENWITKVLRDYCMPKLDEVTVRFPFNSTSSKFIQDWIKFSLKKGVTRLELDLYHTDYQLRMISYAFPKKKRLRAMLKQYSGIVNLREVCLKGVHVSPKVIQFMLNKCPIEHLCLRQSYFSELRISGESIRSKRLELNRSSYISSRLERLELKRSKKALAGRGGGDVWISASSLVSLKYEGPKSFLHLEHVPNLSELSVDPEYCHSETLLEPDRTHFRCIVTRLKKLELALSSIEKGGGNRPEFPTELLEATSLEELTVTLKVDSKSCVLWPILLINSAPYLSKITIKLNQLERDKFFWPRAHREQRIGHHHRVNISDAANRVGSHQHLRVVELHGYRNLPCYLELAKKLMCISAVLEQFVVAPDEPLLYRTNRSRNEAKELAMLLSFGSNVKITILGDNFGN